MCLKDAFECFIRSRRIRGLSEKTVRCYDMFVTPFIQYLGETSLIEEVDRTSVEDYIESLYKNRVSRATHATYIRHLKVFLRWSEEEYGVEMSAKNIHVPRTPKKVLHIYSDDDIRMIFEAVDIAEKWITYRNRSIIALMLDSGLRQGEVCTLCTKNIDMKTGVLKVCGKGNKERIVPFGIFSKKYMSVYRSECPYDAEYFFVSRRGEQMTCDSVKHFMSKISGKLPFEFSSHRLRHNFATNYCLDQYEQRGQVDIYRLMVLMGHEEVNTTRRYLHFANQIIATRSNISHLDKVHFEDC